MFFSPGNISNSGGGIQGPRGPKGDKGDTGPQGPKGERGEKGEKGDAGGVLPEDKIDYLGVSHNTLKETMDSNVDFVLGEVREVNSVHYEGQYITALNSLAGQAKNAILKGQTTGGIITLTASDYSFVGYVNDQDNQFGSEGVYYPSNGDRSTDFIDISSLGDKFSIIFNVPLKADSTYPYGYSHYSLFDKNKAVIKGANAKFTEETKTKLDVDRTNFPTAKYIRISLNVALNMDVVNGGTILQGEELKSSKFGASKNLLDYSLEPELRYFGPNGTWEGTTTPTVNQVIPIETSTITFSFDEKIGDSYLRLGELDNSRRFIKRTLFNTLTTVELDTNTKYVVFSIDKSDTSDSGRARKFVNPKITISTESSALTTTGKNLFNYQGEELNCYYNVADNQGKAVRTPHNKVNSYFIEVLPNTTYTISYKSSTALGLSHIGYWDKNKTFITGETDKKDYLTRTITTPSGCKYVSFPLGNTGVSDIQFEMGAQATSYEPYKINNLMCNEDVELRGIDDVKDTLDLITGEYVQRIGERVYEQGDELNSLVKTDMINTQYELAEPIIKTVYLSDNHVYSYQGTTHYSFETEGNPLIPTLSLDVPTKLNALVARQKDTIQELTQENESLKAAQQILLNSQLSFYETLVSTIPSLMPTEGQSIIPDFIQDLYKLKNNLK